MHIPPPRMDYNVDRYTRVESREQRDLSWYLPLCKSALNGDWESARSFFNRDKHSVTAIVTETSETVLHIAVGTGKASDFVDRLLELMPPEALESLTDHAGETALHYAAIFGNTEAAKLLVAKNPRLPNTLNHTGMVPLHAAAAYGQRGMVLYLLTVTRENVERNPFAGEPGLTLLNLVIAAEFYDVALQLVLRYPQLATLGSSTGNTALNVFAGKPSKFLSGSSLTFWQNFVYKCVPLKLDNLSKKPSRGDMESSAESSQGYSKTCCLSRLFKGSHFGSVCQKLHAVLWDVLKRIARVKDIEDTKMMHHQTRQLVKCLCKETMGLGYAEATSIFRMSVLSAARLGIHEIVEEILESFPSAIRFQDGQACNIIQLAVMYRRENVFNLLYQMTERRKLIAQTIDINANTLLHLAAKLAPVDQLSRVSGAAMQMQRELQWYKEVEKFIRPDYIEMQNLDGKTPQALFTEEHKFLVEVGEKWMKDTADSCTVASTLIATIAFAAAITVPGGNNDDNGIPNFAKEAAFICFAISNALSLFSSTASLLMFLSIRTARYEEADFLYALPHRLSMGFITLFLSITSMMMTFSATLYLMFGHAKTWILIPVAGFSLLPVSLFVALQFPFLLQMIKPTYGRGVFGKKSDRLLY